LDIVSRYKVTTCDVVNWILKRKPPSGRSPRLPFGQPRDDKQEGLPRRSLCSLLKMTKRECHSEAKGRRISREGERFFFVIARNEVTKQSLPKVDTLKKLSVFNWNPLRGRLPRSFHSLTMTVNCQIWDFIFEIWDCYETLRLYSR